MTALRVAALFVRKNSVYKSMPGVDAWDIERDARNFAGDEPVVAHPPCRAWGRLRHLAKPRPDEKDLALFAVASIRRNGGVLEHPKGSTLWEEANLPAPGKRDEWGGWSLLVNQHWWGHRAEKATLLYICGCEPRELPRMPIRLDEPTHVINTSSRHNDGRKKTYQERYSRKKECSKAEREATPIAFAAWLCEVARRCA
jgi:hypothetical protein